MSQEVSSPTCIEEIISHNIRSVEKIYELFGLDGITKLRDHVERIRVLSVFSGLGGAELMVENNYAAIKKKCEELGLRPPKRPRNLGAAAFFMFCASAISALSAIVQFSASVSQSQSL